MTPFCAAVLAAEAEGEGQSEAALALWQRAIELAGSDFQRAYAWGGLGSAQISQNRFEEAVGSWRQAFQFSEAVPWQDWILEYAFNLANLFSHLARFEESERFFRLLLEKIPAERVEQRVMISQHLGAALIEQGKYREASVVLNRCLELIGNDGAPIERAIADLHLARCFNLLGNAGQAQKHLETAAGLLANVPMDQLKPYLQLGEARLALLQGSFGSAFRLLEDAGLGFDKDGDLAGKIEVLLHLSAPLLELNLIKEAEGMINQLAAWQDLVRFPALQHAIRLRRLVLGVFSGHWAHEDIDVLLKNPEPIGRFEDWLQFWFHLSLAAQRISNPNLMKSFLGLSKAMLDKVYGDLTPEQRALFVTRPDVARLLRLISQGSSERKAPAMRAKRALPSSDSADMASLAPPSKNEK